MKGAIAVLNSGSSSIKFSLYEIDENQGLSARFNGQIDGIGIAPRFYAKNSAGEVMDDKAWEDSSKTGHGFLLDFLVGWIGKNLSGCTLRAVGHRVVHGGEQYSHPVLVDENVLKHLEAYEPLAPLHQPHNLVPIRAMLKKTPELPQVACFDTAFHSTQAGPERIFPLPRALTSEGVRRYGFHGLSYEYIASRLSDYDPKASRGKTVVLHIGSGVSMCALGAGKSVASSMGFSALDGLPMGSRTGTLDPGVILYLLQEKRMGAKDIESLLYRESGLLGVSGISNDMRILLENRSSEAMEAVDLFVYRICKELGGLAAALEGLDAVVFTAGIGENSAEIRERICEKCRWLGIHLNPEANRVNGPRISLPESPVSAWVIPTNEELMIARHTLKIVGD